MRESLADESRRVLCGGEATNKIYCRLIHLIWFLPFTFGVSLGKHSRINLATINTLENQTPLMVHIHVMASF